MNKYPKIRILADLIDKPEQLDFMIADRLKYRKLMWVWYAFASGYVFFNLNSDAHEISSYVIIGILIFLSLKNEMEWQLLHIVKKQQELNKLTEPVN